MRFGGLARRATLGIGWKSWRVEEFKSSRFVRESKIDGVNDANFREEGNTDLLGFRRIRTDYLFVAGFLGFWLGSSGLKSWRVEKFWVLGCSGTTNRRSMESILSANDANSTNWGVEKLKNWGVLGSELGCFGFGVDERLWNQWSDRWSNGWSDGWSNSFDWRGLKSWDVLGFGVLGSRGTTNFTNETNWGMMGLKSWGVLGSGVLSCGLGSFGLGVDVR